MKKRSSIRKKLYWGFGALLLGIVLFGGFVISEILEIKGELKSYSQMQTSGAADQSDNARVVAERQADKAYQHMQGALKQAVAVSAIFLLMLVIGGALFAVQLTGKITSALSAVMRVAERVCKGDLTEERLEVGTNDEVEALAEIFNAMTQNLREKARVAEKIAEGDLTVRPQAASEKDVLGNASIRMTEKLRSLISEIHQQSGQVLSSATGLSQASEQTSQAITQLTNTVSQISNATSNVAHNSQTAANSATQADTVAKRGREAVEKTLAKMQSIQSTIDHASHSMQELMKSSQQIGEIVNVITKIADQTNLLSLNAAIEAARAGEDGKGFAVVADEVRKLAEVSQKQAMEISKIIHGVLENSKRAESIVRQGKKDVEEGGVMVNETYQAFVEIAKAIENVARQIEQIAASGQETAASAEEVTASSEEQTAAIEQIAGSARQLTGIVNVMNAAANKFKL